MNNTWRLGGKWNHKTPFYDGDGNLAGAEYAPDEARAYVEADEAHKATYYALRSKYDDIELLLGGLGYGKMFGQSLEDEITEAKAMTDEFIESVRRALDDAIAYAVAMQAFDQLRIERHNATLA